MLASVYRGCLLSLVVLSIWATISPSGRAVAIGSVAYIVFIAIIVTHLFYLVYIAVPDGSKKKSRRK